MGGALSRPLRRNRQLPWFLPTDRRLFGRQVSRPEPASSVNPYSGCRDPATVSALPPSRTTHVRLCWGSQASAWSKAAAIISAGSCRTEPTPPAPRPSQTDDQARQVRSPPPVPTPAILRDGAAQHLIDYFPGDHQPRQVLLDPRPDARSARAVPPPPHGPPSPGAAVHHQRPHQAPPCPHRNRRRQQAPAAAQPSTQQVSSSLHTTHPLRRLQS